MSAAVTDTYQFPGDSVVQRHKDNGIRTYQTNWGPKEQDFAGPEFGNDHIVCRTTGGVQGLGCAYRRN